MELAGDIHSPHLGDRDAVLDAVEHFLTGRRRAHDPERVLATVLFTDMVEGPASFLRARLRYSA